MDTFVEDLRYSFRMMASKPGFTAVAIVTFALGIGANTTMFSVFQGVLLRPLPFPEPHQIMTLWTMDRSSGGATEPVSPLDFLDWREQNRSFTHLAAYEPYSFVLKQEHGAKRLKAARVSGDFFSVLDTPPAVGRAIHLEDDRPGRERQVVLSHRLRQNEFGAEVDIVGRALILNGETYTISGVMPAGFGCPGDVDLWAPLILRPSQLLPSERASIWLRVLGRLQAGRTPDQAQSEMSVIASRLERRYPDTNRGRSIAVIPLREHLVGEVRPALIVLLGAVSLVLLIACANVAHLLLVRSMTRQKELAIRAALGASKARIVRQLLTESTLLACLGGAAGIVIALWGLDLVRTFIAGGMPRLKESVLDGNVLGFTWIVSLGTGILSGVAPAWMATRKSTYLPGRVDSSQSGHKLSRRFRHLLVVAEIASALALLASGGLLMQSFLRLRAVDPGFDEENVLTSQFELFSQRYEEKNARLAFYDELVENVAALPNVRGAALATSVPLQDVHFGYEFSIEGRSQPNRAGLPSAGYDCVIPEYFRVMGIRLVAGRSFTDADRPDTLPVVIINDTMARLFWPDDDPVGQRIRIRADQSSEDAPSIELVGVVESARTIALDRRARPEMFFPYSQRPWRSGFLILRLDAGATDVPASVRTAALAVDKDVALSDFRSMEDYLSTSVARPRFRTMLLAAFAALALVLASVGVYGVVGYSVSLRSHEIGIRVALGARPAEILRLFTREGLRLALIGVGIGLMAAFGLTRFLSSLLFGIEPTDGATLASASGLLVAITLLACYLPARHATRVDPLATLRSE